NEQEFYQRLDKMMDISARSLKIKRQVITKLLQEGLYPYTKKYLGNFDSHFSTIGLFGMNEATMNAKWIKSDITQEGARKFALDVLDHMRNRLSDYQEEYGDLYNLEATPAESTSYRLAKHDKKQYGDILSAGKEGETPYYTNSTHLPVNYTTDVFDALDMQDEFQNKYTSGTVFHAFLGEKLPDWKAAANLVKTIADNYTLPYYTISPTYSVCKTHGYIPGEEYTCPHCGASTEVYSRITGYYRPVQHWNDGKAQEFKHRKEYEPAKSTIKSIHTSFKAEEEIAATSEVANTAEKLLFTTKTCPNCHIAKQYLENKSVKIIDAEEHAELATKYKIRTAPTLIVIDDENVNIYMGLSDIKKYAESEKLEA
ncbi:anaerobic ribonucleoside-triphosphate reductase, partial [Vallitalea guaymasensis]|uniref:anaerobic ribonucleoside-triphosphate reductase n=1 Tax=Vallitalea guaymasensis TaxID=1185412 RepID=UPI00272D8AD0